MKFWVHLYRLANDEFAKWLVPIGLLCAGTFVSTLVLLHFEVRDYQSYTVHERFEDLYLSSGSAYLFAVFFLLLCGYFVINVYSDYWGSKAIYTYMTLPVRREALYMSKLIVFILCMLLLIAAELASVYVAYGIVEAKVGSYADGRFLMNNGLFLAFIRSHFLRLLLPLGWSGFVSTISILLALAAAIYYVILCERSRRRYGFLFVAAAIYMVIDAVGYRLDHLNMEVSAQKLYVSSVLLLLLSSFFVWHSLRLLRKGAAA